MDDLDRATHRHAQVFPRDEYVSATTGLLEAFATFRQQVKRVIGVRVSTGIPIGCLTSRLIANLALSRLDRAASTTASVAFYARYVDDIILVVDPENSDITAAVEVLARCLPVDRTRSTDIRIVLDENALQRPGSSFVIQQAKLRIFDLKGEQGIEYLGAVSAEMNRASSERRKFLEPAGSETDQTVAVSNTAEPVRALRNADALSLRRLAANTVCSKVVTSAAMLTHSEAALYSRTHLGVAGRLATDWSRWVEMVDVALYVLAAALLSGDVETADEVISGLLARIEGLRNDTTVVIKWGHHSLRHDRASRLIKRWVLAQLRETLGAALPVGAVNGSEVLDKLFSGALGDVDSDLLTRAKLTSVANRLSTADLRLLDRETDHSLGVIPAVRDPKSFATLAYELRQDPSHVQRLEDLQGFVSTCQSITDPVYSNLQPFDLLLMPRPPSYADILMRWLRAEHELEGLAKVINAVRGTRYAELPMQEVDGVLYVEHAASAISGPSGVGSTRIILGNLCTEDTWWLASLASPVLTRERQRRFTRVLNKAIYAARNSLRKGIPSILVLPELSLPQRWLREVVKHLSYRAPYLTLLTGLEYNVVGGIAYNEAMCFVPRTYSTAAAWIWTKGRPAHAEGPALVAQKFAFGTRGHNRRFHVMSTEHGRFVPLICSELLEVDSRARLLGRVDIVMVPAWNQDLLSFEYVLQATCLDLHSFVAVANNGIYSDCRVRGPYADSWRRDSSRLLSRGENEIVVANIPVDLLRDYRADAHKYAQKINAWLKKHPKKRHECPFPTWKPPAPK